MQQLAFENELIVVNNSDRPINTIDNKTTSRALLDILASRGKIGLLTSGAIDGELDACQIEIKNASPHSSLESAQDELATLLNAVNDIVTEEFGLYLSTTPLPNQDFQPVHSGLKPKYEKIHNLLMSRGVEVRKGTNIAGLHMHLQEPPDFSHHRKISTAVSQLLREGKYDQLLLHPERHGKYAQVVKGLQQLGFVRDSYLPVSFDQLDTPEKLLLDGSGKPIFNYRYAQLKQFGSHYTTELRTPDGAYDIDSLYAQTTRTHDLIFSILDHEPISSS